MNGMLIGRQTNERRAGVSAFFLLLMAETSEEKEESEAAKFVYV